MFLLLKNPYVSFRPVEFNDDFVLCKYVYYRLFRLHLRSYHHVWLFKKENLALLALVVWSHSPLPAT